MILVQRKIKDYKPKKTYYGRRHRFLKEFFESDMDDCVVEGWQLNYKKASYCATSLQEGVKKYYKGLIEVKLIGDEVWIVRTSALKK